MKRKFNRRKKAVSGIISATILFTILFSTGATYFLYVASLSQQQQIASKKQGDNQQLLKLEQLSVNGRLVGNNVGFFVNNTGAVAAKILYVFLSNSTYLKFMDSSDTSVNPRLPVTLNVGASLSSFDTGVQQTAGSLYTIKVVTERGNVAVGFYPQPTISVASLALLAIVSQGSGFLALDFNTFRAYNTTGTAPGCNPSNPGCQLSSGVPGYTLKAPKSTGRFIVFSANVTNVDPAKRSLTLDSDTVLVQFLTPKPGTGGGTASAWSWGIGRVNATTGITQSWPAGGITISYLQTITVYFTAIPTPTINQWPASGDFTAVFMYFHGTIASTTYGQNIPFVTTKYT